MTTLNRRLTRAIAERQKRREAIARRTINRLVNDVKSGLEYVMTKAGAIKTRITGNVERFIGNLLANKGKKDASGSIAFDLDSFTPGVGMIAQIKGVYDVGAMIAALYSTENDNIFRFSKGLDTYNIVSDTAFTYIPFIAWVENGESIALTDKSTDPVFTSLIDESISGHYNVKIGEAIMSQPKYSNNVRRNEANGQFNWQEIANAYSKEYAKNGLKEQAQQALIVQCQSTNTQVDNYTRRFVSYNA